MAEDSIAEAFSLLGISLGIILLRMISRISLVGTRKLQLDDYLMVLAGVSFVRFSKGEDDTNQRYVSVCIPPRLLLPIMLLSTRGSQTAS